MVVMDVARTLLISSICWSFSETFATKWRLLLLQLLGACLWEVTLTMASVQWTTQQTTTGLVRLVVRRIKLNQVAVPPQHQCWVEMGLVSTPGVLPW